MTDLVVDIVTPEKIAYSGAVREVRIPGLEGEFGVLPGHTFFLSLIQPGVAVVETPSGAERFVVGRGFAEAGPDKVVLLTDTCIPAADVDKAEAEALLADAEARLARLEPQSDAWLAASRDRSDAMAQLRV